MARATLAAEMPAERERLNVLFVVSDDHAYDALGCAGKSIVRTPNLDRLAGEGVRFSHAFVSVPICTPSRAAILTGRFEQSNGVAFFGESIREEVVPLPRVLARAGYQTAFTGKWHNVRRPDYYGFDWTANMFIGGMGHYRDPRLTQRVGEKPEVVKGFSTELFADAAVRFLDQRDTNRPFFLYLAFTAPHDPREPLPEYERMYPPKDIPLPANFVPTPRFDPGTLAIRDEKLLPLPRDPEQIRIERGRYYAQITHMDEQIGRVLRKLDELKLADRTIIVFVGDNGLTLGAHGLLGKQTLYDEGVRVPLILRHPRVRAASPVTAALVHHTDILPTVFEWAGVPLPEGVQGKSLVKAYAVSGAEVRDAVFGRYDERDDPRFRSIRTKRHKLIRYLKLKREELFDLQADPHELKDLSDDPAMSEAKTRLRAQLKDWIEQQGDTIAQANWF